MPASRCAEPESWRARTSAGTLSASIVLWADEPCLGQAVAALESLDGREHCGIERLAGEAVAGEVVRGRKPLLELHDELALVAELQRRALGQRSPPAGGQRSRGNAPPPAWC